MSEGRLDVLVTGLVQESLRGLDDRFGFPGLGELAGIGAKAVVDNLFEGDFKSLRQVNPMVTKGIEVLVNGFAQREAKAKMNYFIQQQQANAASEKL